LRTLRDALHLYMRDPGRAARRWLAGLAAVLVSVPLLRVGLSASAGHRPGVLGLVAVALASAAAYLVVVDLLRGHRRPILRPWRSKRAAYPRPWTFEKRPAALPSVPVLFVGGTYLLLVEHAFHAGSWKQGLERAAWLIAFLSGLWMCRVTWDAVRPLERSRAHRVAWHLVAWLFHAARRLATAVHAALAASVLVLVSLGFAAPDPSAVVFLKLGLVLLGLQIMLGMLLREWPASRPSRRVSAAEIAALTDGTALERRVSGALGLAGMAWAVAHVLPT
jgi:hypothetical protein